MKIGDEVYVHGYVDEMRNDVIIIRNDGGYFGTVGYEVLDKDTEEYKRGRIDALNELMEYTYGMLTAEKFGLQHKIKSMIWDAMGIADTPQTDKDKVVCPNCGRSDYIRSFEKDFNIKNSEYRYKCINCNTYIKDTPQTESTGSPIGDYRDGVGAWQTDCGWK